MCGLAKPERGGRWRGPSWSGPGGRGGSDQPARTSGTTWLPCTDLEWALTRAQERPSPCSRRPSHSASRPPSRSPAVTVYKNDFSRKAEAKELRHSSGKHCGKSWRKKAESVRVQRTRGSGACGYRPPVEGDTDGPDHDFRAKAKLLQRTPKGIRGGAYVAIAVRSGRSSGYELRVFPKKHKFELAASPSGGGGGFPATGTSQAIKGVKQAERRAPEGRRQQGDGEGQRDAGWPRSPTRTPARSAGASWRSRSGTSGAPARTSSPHRQPQAPGPESVERLPPGTGVRRTKPAEHEH